MMPGSASRGRRAWLQRRYLADTSPQGAGPQSCSSTASVPAARCAAWRRRSGAGAGAAWRRRTAGAGAACPLSSSPPHVRPLLSVSPHRLLPGAALPQQHRRAGGCGVQGVGAGPAGPGRQRQAGAAVRDGGVAGRGEVASGRGGVGGACAWVVCVGEWRLSDVWWVLLPPLAAPLNTAGRAGGAPPPSPTPRPAPPAAACPRSPTSWPSLWGPSPLCWWATAWARWPPSWWPPPLRPPCRGWLCLTALAA